MCDKLSAEIYFYFHSNHKSSQVACSLPQIVGTNNHILNLLRSLHELFSHCSSAYVPACEYWSLHCQFLYECCH